MAYLDNRKAGLLGLLVGIALGIMFAPKSGRETREDMRKEGSKAWKKSKPKIEHAAKKAAHMSEKLVDDSAAVVENVEMELDKLSAKTHDLNEKIAKFSEDVFEYFTN